MVSSENVGFAEEVKKLKKLLKDGDITKKQYEKAKERFLSDFQEENEHDEEVDYEQEEEVSQKRAKTYYTFVTITTILSVFLLGGGIITGVVIGGILGLVGYLIGRSTSRLLSKYLVFIFLSITVNVLAGTIIYTISSEESTNTNITSNPGAEALKAYYDCSDGCYEAYRSRWKETCASKGEDANCLLPNETVVSYDDSLQNELDRCAVRYKDQIPKNEELYNSCRDSAYDSYHDRWNGKCKNMGEENECQLPSITADTYENTLQRALDRCVLIFQ